MFQIPVFAARQLLLAIFAVFLAFTAQAAEYRADLEIRLGGDFVNHWANNPRSGVSEQAVNYYSALPGKNNSTGMQVIVYGGIIKQMEGGVRGFYEHMHKGVGSHNSLSPTTVRGAECQTGRSTVNPNYITYLCLVDPHVLLLTVANTGTGKIDAAAQAATLVARLQAGAAAVPGDYAEMMQILRQYRPTLFASLPEASLLAALKQREKGLVGPGPTENLRQMLREIKSLRAFIAKPVIGSADALAKSPVKTRDFKDLLWDVAEAVKDHLPEAGSRLLGVSLFFKDAADKMVELRDTWVIPAQAEALYQQYRRERGSGSDQDSHSAYSRLRIGLAQVRSAPEFKSLSEAQFDRIFRGRLEARYQLEMAEIQRASLRNDQERIVSKIVQKYDNKIGQIHKTATEIASRR